MRYETILTSLLIPLDIFIAFAFKFLIIGIILENYYAVFLAWLLDVSACLPLMIWVAIVICD